MKNINANEFLRKYAENKYTEQEHQEFIDWLNRQSINKAKKILKEYYSIHKDALQVRDEAKPILTTEKKKELLSKIEQAIMQSEGKVKPIGFYRFLKNIAAIAALFFVAVSVFHYFHKTSEPGEDNISYKQEDITSLVLQDGSVLNMDSVRIGEEIVQGAVRIKKSEDGKLIYNVDTANEPDGDHTSSYNIINTSTGRQAFVKLSDGTKVWLNAASSLKFPVHFTTKERIVELEGEAYFEVSKDKKAFRVLSNGQEVEVLGTHFNVNAYGDSQYVKTTLVEGSVRLMSYKSKEYVVLRPGEQGVRSDKGLAVKQVDVEEVIGWKKGLFVFSNESIYSVMREIARWYDVEVVYEGQVTKEGFVMNISRSEDINDVLKKLEITGLVHFKLQPGDAIRKERRVIVMP